jgi:hypothetical protein
MAIDLTLRELDSWYNDLPGGNERPKLLSKLAILELCGWIELRMDEITRNVATKLSLDLLWVENKVIAKTHGFEYHGHFREMLRMLMGEAGILKIEGALGEQEGGDLAQLKSMLGSLWEIRGKLAHTNTSAGTMTQKSIGAPSWSNNQYRVISKLLMKFEEESIKGLD